MGCAGVQLILHSGKFVERSTIEVEVRCPTKKSWQSAVRPLAGGRTASFSGISYVLARYLPPGRIDVNVISHLWRRTGDVSLVE